MVKKKVSKKEKERIKHIQRLVKYKNSVLDLSDDILKKNFDDTSKDILKTDDLKAKKKLVSRLIDIKSHVFHLWILKSFREETLDKLVEDEDFLKIVLK